MKKLLLLSLSLLTTACFAAEDAEKLAIEKCGSCHIMGALTKEKIANMKAPPYWSMARKARENFATKDQRVKYVMDFILNPTREKSLYPPETFKKFGLMPSQKGKVTEKEARLITEYVLENISAPKAE